MVDERFFRETLERAGELALRSFHDVSMWHKKDRTYVTEADLAIQSFLIDALARKYPSDGVVAEENGVRKRPVSGDRYWVIDPIDGTASYVAGLSEWCVSVGLVEGGRPVAGFVWKPVSADFFSATPCGPVCRNGRTRRMRRPGPLGHDTILFTHSRPHQRYTLSADYPGKVFSLGSASVHLSHVATGGADAVLIGHDRIWDLAPGAAMLHRNGGTLRYLRGGDVDMGQLLPGQPAPHPMLGGHPEVIARIEAHIDYHSPTLPW